MTLEEYLTHAGFAPAYAKQIAEAYRSGPARFQEWLQAGQLPVAPIVALCDEWRKTQTRSGAFATIVEPLAARSFCVYKVVGPDQAFGRCWAAMRIPARFPGSMDAGGDPAEYAIVAAEQDPDTQLFKWVSLTPNLKATFGYCLEAGNVALNQWAIVREFDLLRGETITSTEPQPQPDPTEPADGQDIPM